LYLINLYKSTRPGGTKEIMISGVSAENWHYM
jgi:hypothetical protein